VSIEQDAAAGGDQKLGQQIENRGLAGTVGADQRMDVSTLNAQTDLIDSHEAFELLDEIAGFQNKVSHGSQIPHAG
jgi:hypothetical protein